MYLKYKIRSGALVHVDDESMNVTKNMVGYASLSASDFHIFECSDCDKIHYDLTIVPKVPLAHSDERKNDLSAKLEVYEDDLQFALPSGKFKPAKKFRKNSQHLKPQVFEMDVNHEQEAA